MIALLLSMFLSLQAPMGGVTVSGTGGGGSSVAYASSCGASPGTSATASCALSGLSAGSTIFVNVIQYTYPSTSPTVSDTGSGTVAQVLGPTVLTSGQSSSSAVTFVIKNAGAGTHTITATYPGAASYIAITAVAVTGASTTSPVDSSAALGNIASGTNTACGNVTTSAGGEFVLAFSQLPGGGSYGVGTSPISMTMVSTSGSNFEYGNAGSAGTTHASWSNTVTYECDTVAVH